jgi:CDP-6-deoxy-D-xylo-4-hexulose-3-dehydrase
LSTSSWDNAEREAILEVLDSGKYSMGEVVERFESDFANFSGTRFAVMFNSGSSANLALLFALRFSKQLSLPAGSQIIVPAVSWSTTFYPVSQAGFELRFVDIDRNTLNLSVSKVKEAITKKTRAIFAVNLLGNPANLYELKRLAEEHDLVLIEDNCESLGAEIDGKKAGTFGLAGTYSFFFSHHICTMEGGMVTTDSLSLSQHLKSIRAHGWTRGLPKENFVHDLSGDEWEDLYRFVIPGFNLRPMEMQAAVGIVQLNKFPTFLNSRRSNGKVFKDSFQGLRNVRTQLENGQSSWFGFAIILEGALKGMRRDLIDRLSDLGVESRPIVAGNFLRNPVITKLPHSVVGKLNVADDVHENGFYLGNHHLDIQSELRSLSKLMGELEKEYLE